MTIIKSEIYQFQLPMIRPITQNKADPMIRSGLLICLTDNNGNKGWGEASPLQGLSIETLEQAKEQLLIVGEAVIGQKNILDVNDSKLYLHPSVKALSLYSSVNIAITTACLELISCSNLKPVSKIINPDASNHIKLNGLVAGNHEQMIEISKKLLVKNYDTLKIKVGRRPVAEEIKTIKEISSICPENINFRFDANRSWSLQDYSQFISELPDYSVEYIEEPLSTFEDYKYLTANSILNKFPIALDESLLTLKPDEVRNLKWVSVLVLKPSLLGFEKTDQLIKIAKQNGMNVTISSLFESSIGTKMLAHYCAARCGDKIAAGLDTISWFEIDTQTNPIEIHSAQIDLSNDSNFNVPNINYSLLKKRISHE